MTLITVAPRLEELQDETRSRHRVPLGTVLRWGATALLIALASAALLFHLSGGRWFVVETPSMGAAAPVGSLVLTEPTAIEDVRVGDVVSFQPAGVPDATYTHRVVAVNDDGTLSTRGDVNRSADPWATGSDQLVGVVTATFPVVGWFLRALPMLLVGSLVIWLPTRGLTPSTQRAATRILGLSLVVSFTVFVLRPLVGIVVLEAAVDGMTTTATLVSTGVLPIQVSAEGADPVDLTSGEVGRMQIPTHDSGGDADTYALSSALHLPFWGWVVYVLVCALPVLYTLVVGLPAEPECTEVHRWNEGSDGTPGVSPGGGLPAGGLPVDGLLVIARVDGPAGAKSLETEREA
ncbi:signal peptidase I [Rathayibacter iranicus]|uniref:Signal peptidase I n=2 Tax=Rathayibacter iranicus TaxID=59737 RepID=A0AAD1EN81_9MICO|nr:signal peptidase I [Rathayibacter iranicus]AZZ56896.1 signal peptidase I [Rathayibacter iranicus]MWV29495.1 signal peptidase I [Rathayibacter iranicus NCPPB 2253 = VKM Ac-1602]PPI42409.1 signal peptidase I [Rathayibacter iranicus]PPI57831.1 signal peptidase I [Rathayibacter iranicus]PPI68769.1 signal peptidase I [Rathayibacter iranicus]